MSAFEIFQGDRNPDIAYTYTKDDGSAQPLTGGSVVFKMRPAAAGADLALTGTASIVSAAAGTVQFAWGVGDTALVNEYRGRFVVTIGAELMTSPEFVVRVVAATRDRGAPGARPSMAELIDRVRRLISDPAGADSQFSDFDVQDALDRGRFDVRYQELVPDAVIVGTTVTWPNYYDSVYQGGWEADAVLTNGQRVVVTPDSFDTLVGRWSFSATYLPPLFVSGRVYDVYDAAANLMEQWGVAEACAVDFEVDGQKVSGSQRIENRMKAAGLLRRRARMTTTIVERSDWL